MGSAFAFVAHAANVRLFSSIQRKTSVSQHDRRSLIAPQHRRARRVKTGTKCVAVAVGPAWGIWTVLFGAAAAGLVANRTSVGKALSPPIVTTLITLTLANVGLLPAAHPSYLVASKVLIPLAVPLLLFAADLRRVARDTGRLLPAFVLGALATVLSIIIAYRVVPLVPALGAHDAWKLAAALCARHIGGAVNFVSTTDTLDVSAAGVTSALAADNIVLSFYFILLFGLARGVRDPAIDRSANAPKKPVVSSGEDTSWAEGVLEEEEGDKRISDTGATEESDVAAKVTVEEMGVALTISAAICYLGKMVTAWLPISLGVLPTITIVSLVLSTLFPKLLGPFSRAGNAIGIFFMQIFFAATAASGSIIGVLKSAPLLFAFIVLHLALHLAILFGVGKYVLKLHPAEILVASNANVGGPATALAMACAKDWKSLMIPSLLIGVLGLSMATFIGLGLGHTVLKVL